MRKTKIEWTDVTWNPVTGCDKVSTGCKHCYAERLFPRVYGKKRKFTDVQLHPDRIDQPMRWRKPRMVFVNSMSDLFHEDVPDEFIFKVFNTIYNSHRHTFQVLTKRPGRMTKFFRIHYKSKNIMHNVWLGTSCENQEAADERIPHLLQTPAAVRFLSCEPLLGEIDLWEWIGNDSKIGWVIVGAESGPKARPMSIADAWIIVKQCKSAGVPVFVKQLCKNGRKIPFEDWPDDLQIREFPYTRN